jgi:hypothetical protein
MLFTAAFANLKIAAAYRLGGADFDFRNIRRAGRSRLQFVNEILKSGFGTFEKYFDAVIAVRNPASQGVCVREPEHKRAETDPLHSASYFDGACVHVLSPITESRARLFGHDAAAALPTNLNNLAVIDQDGDGSLSTG